MGVYKYDATNDELIQIAGAPSTHELEDKVSTYTADATYWDTTPTAASTKPVISDGIKTQFDLVHNELSDVNNILGSKNILPNSATTQVINGITYTVAADGSINVNGTASADSILHIVPGTTGKLSNIFSKGGNYIISVGTTGTGVNVFFGIEYTGSTWDIAEWLTYSTRLSKEIYIDGTELNNSSSYIECYIKVNSGTTVSNIKVYPMLRPAKVKDATYVPYSKTNYELTTEISNFTHRLLYSGNVANNDSITLASNNCAFYIITFKGRGISTIIPYTVTRALLYGCVPDSNAYLHASVTFMNATQATIKYKYGADWSGSSESLEIYGYGVR